MIGGVRADQIAAFLALAGWGRANRAPLAGDASNRRYERLIDPAQGRAVLMDAPPQKGEDIRPFVRIARHLTARGLSAPRIFAADEALGLLLLEDLGDDLFARVLADRPALEEELYDAATLALIAAQDAPPADLPLYHRDEMAEAA